ncbi:medium-chain fatty acid-CoA ligase faa2 [Coemansia sp. RSA 1813]|nr:medium-chain fatty acid-CoA ligase faa2 [Coemansia sp. RSA 1646]KAJ1769778.1 medium-chain fatty acid-CoA ligase faa2 [Coemansia sp. RSA 1843]KAJ2086858.1 medium-chain fatty acid-CoA ligase faa2 [Coemansia sp. RSA 986]KAJ2215193.1 medium-chain fatty acid-CoA ligase faa2 [Coemansia sp. RSA 487]KAJ2572293.1 medium-chain fatty acid-CoA ligase faa2 [Coemansia sp. RSA 1813]
MPSSASGNTPKKSYRVPNSEVPGSTYIIRHPDDKDSLEIPLLRDYYADNVFGMFQESARRFSSDDFVGRRPYSKETNKFGDFEWTSYGDAYDRAVEIGSGLVHLLKRHVRPDADIAALTKLPLGMYASNRVEWILADYAGLSQNLYTVALYDTLGADSIEYIVNHAEIEVLVCSLDKVPKLLKMREKLPQLKVIVSMDNFGEDIPDEALPSPFNTSSVTVLKQWAEAAGIALYDLASVAALGANEPVPIRMPKPDDIFCLCYTSGTTGTPKAAKIMHNNMDYIQRIVPLVVNISSRPVILAYLPLAHIYERFCEIYNMSMGGKIGVYSGNILNVVDDIQTLRPNVFNSVPRLLNRIYDRLVAGTIHAPGLTGVIARRAVADKFANLEAGKGNTHAFWDRILFRKIRALLGGNIEFVLTGSAPIDKNVLQFLRICFCCQVSEGWGATETCGVGILNTKTENQGGRVGIPLQAMEVKLVDVPDMNYLATDKPCPRGELMIRGPCVFGGYHKDPKKTVETILEDGWLATGDVGRINEDGTISIIDRKKNIFKLSQGEYVAPEALENIYGNDSCVQQVFVHGDSLQSCLVGVVVPDPETFVPWAQKLAGDKSASLESLCISSTINAALCKRLAAVGRKAKLQGYEILKAIKIEHRPFDVETNGILTPTMKLKRNIAAEYYRPDIDEMYAAINADGSK